MKKNIFSVERIEHMYSFFSKLELIGSGLYSGVFESGNSDTVLKATICPATYHMLNDESLKIEDIHSPKIIKNYGQVGSYRESHTKLINCKLSPLYLFEVERLKPIPKGENYDLLLSFSSEFNRKLFASKYNIGFGNPEATQILLELVKTMPQLEMITTLHTYFEKLGCFVAAYGNAFYDIRSENIMQRLDGTIVFSDPIGTGIKGMTRQNVSLFSFGLRALQLESLLSNRYLKLCRCDENVHYVRKLE